MIALNGTDEDKKRYKEKARAEGQMKGETINDMSDNSEIGQQSRKKSMTSSKLKAGRTESP